MASSRQGFRKSDLAKIVQVLQHHGVLHCWRISIDGSKISLVPVGDHETENDLDRELAEFEEARHGHGKA